MKTIRKNAFKMSLKMFIVSSNCLYQISPLRGQGRLVKRRQKECMMETKKARPLKHSRTNRHTNSQKLWKHAMGLHWSAI